MMRVLLVLCVVMLGGSSVWAAPALQVQQADEKTLVRATTDKLAAWRATPDTLVVVIPAANGNVDIGALPEGVTAEAMADQGLQGVVLRGVSGSWQVVQDGSKWLLRPGAGLKSDSVLMLRDGWRVGQETVMPTSFQVLGKTWQVGLVSSAKSVAGSVVGVVRVQGAAVEMARTAAPVVEALPEVAAVKVSAVKVSATGIRPEIQHAEMPALLMRHEGTDGKVAMEATAPLRALGQPTMAAVALPAGRASRMTIANMNAMLARIEPAAGPGEGVVRVVPASSSTGLMAPHGVAGKGGEQVVGEPSPSRGLTKVAVHPAESMNPMSLGGVTAEVLQPILSDIYMPGTFVSLTMPVEKPEEKVEMGPKAAAAARVAEVTAQAVVSASVSSTARISSTWNQVTLAPIEAALQAAKEPSVTVAAPTPVARADERDDAAPDTVTNRILPARSGLYFDDVSDALQTIAETPAHSVREADAKLALAAVYLTWQRPEEALAVLDSLPQRSDKVPVSAQGRLFTAIAKLARGQQPEANLLDLGGPLEGHAKLWKAVAASQKGEFAAALKLWPQERGLLPQYPGYLRELAQKAQVTAMVMVGDRKFATKVVDELIAGYDNSSTVPVGLTRLQGLVRLGTPEEGKGLEYLASAAENMRDPVEAYRAKYDFVKALQQRHDLSDEQVRAYLNDLWFDWRGDDLERDVLNSLADLYEKAGDSRTALQYWQILVRAFPKDPDLGQLTEKMTNAFLKVFDPENPKIYDTLDYVGMYYDFSELVPNDARGDLVQEQVSRLLVNANLWEKAVPILEQQLRYRPLDAAAQGRLALLLAEADGNLGLAGDGIKVLDKWAHVATTSTLAHDWKVEEAKLMLKLNRPANASKALAGLPKDDVEVRDLKIEAAWAAQDWSTTIPLMEERLAHVPAAALVSDTGAQLAAFRLAYAYGQQRQAANLDALSKRYESGLAKLPQLADGMGAVAASTGVSASVMATGPLAPVTLSLNNLNRLTENVEATRKAVATQRAEQKEYNDKMRYMELLPPPAI